MNIIFLSDLLKNILKSNCSLFYLDDYIFTWSNNMQQCTITIHLCVKYTYLGAMQFMCIGQIQYIYEIIYQQNFVKGQFS